MSFAERNKTWLLPVLVVGVAAVLWFDLRDSAPPPAAIAPPDAATAPPPTGSPVSVAAPTPTPDGQAPPAATTLPSLDAEAWSDLRPLNTVPGVLNQSQQLTEQATRPLSQEQLSPPVQVTIGGGALLTPSTLTLDANSGSGNSAPPPVLDFISRTPEGYRAWYDGVGFKVGQLILGTPYRIREIRPPKVVLDGPGGRVDQATFTLAPPEAASPDPETP